MKLIEERKLIIIEIILLTFVTFLSVGLQICDNNINNYQNNLHSKQIELNTIEAVRISQKISSLKYFTAAFFNANLDYIDYNDVSSNDTLRLEFKKIVQQYKNGEIDKNEYFNKLSVEHNRNAIRIGKAYSDASKEIQQLYNSPPKSLNIRSILFIIQFIAIIISIIIYLLIYKSIYTRSNK